MYAKGSSLLSSYDGIDRDGFSERYKIDNLQISIFFLSTIYNSVITLIISLKLISKEKNILYAAVIKSYFSYSTFNFFHS